MLHFCGQSTRGIVMSSLLGLSFLLGAACGPTGELDDSSEQLTPEITQDEAEQNAPVPGDESDESMMAASPEEGTEQSESSDQVQAAAVTLRTVAAWESLFLGIWNSTHNNDWLPRSRSLDSYQFYNLGYGIDGNTAMYRATGKTQYLDRALLYINNMVNNAKVSSTLRTSQYKDSYLGWTSSSLGTSGEVPLWESYCWRYVTRVLRVIRETPALYSNPTYRSQYDRLLAFTERNMFEKWYRRGANANIYRVRTHMVAHWALIALDLSRMTTDATKRALYLQVLNNINRDLPNSTSSLRQQMRPNPRNSAAYFWSAVWGSTSQPGQDMAHGNGVMAYIVEANQAGVEWTNDDMRKFVTTLNNVAWPSTGRYSNYVDGSGTGNGWYSDGWIKLGRYDANLQRRIEAHTVGRTIQFYGNGALNARILSGQPTP